MSVKPDEEERLRALDKAIELAASGKVDEAIEVILDNIPDHEPMVTTALKAERALEAVRTGSSEGVHSAVLYELASDLAGENDLERALKIAKLIPGEPYRSLALSHLSVFLAEAGRFEEAVTTLAEITDPLDRSSTVIKVAEQLALAGEPEKAVDLARQITDEGYRAMAFEELGTAFIDVGQCEYALECLRNGGAEGSELWFEACARIARQLARRAELFRAFKIVREIEDDYIRSKALQWIETELVIRRMLARLDE